MKRKIISILVIVLIIVFNYIYGDDNKEVSLIFSGFNIVILFLGLVNTKSKYTDKIMYISLYIWIGLYILKAFSKYNINWLLVCLFFFGLIYLCVSTYNLSK